MCAKVGVDPLASNKGFWAELLGIGDFYYELGGYQTYPLIFRNYLVAAFMLFPVTLALPSSDKHSVSVPGSVHYIIGVVFALYVGSVFITFNCNQSMDLDRSTNS